MARRILNRKELRADYDAAERRTETEEEEVEDEEEGDEDEEEEEGEEEEGAAEEEDEEEEEVGDEDDEEERPKKKKPKKAKPKKPATTRAKPRRTAKVTRMRVVWGVFNNSHQCVATYAYPKKGEAEEHAARLTNDKRSTHFIQPVKEAMEDEK